MTNEELIAKIKAEIERRVDILATVYVKQEKDGDSEMSTYYYGKAVSLEELLSFLSTLESEKPIEGIEGLEVASVELAESAKFSSGMDGFYHGQGYRDGKKDTIERAVKWLQEHAKEYIVNIGIDDSQELVVGGMCWVYLKQALEGEENE